MADTTQSKIWNKVFISVFMANMCLNLSKQMVNTLITKYADVLGASAVMVGFISSSFAITALLFKVFSGPINDACNRKYVLMFSTLVMAAAYVGYGFSGNVNNLIVCRLIQGAGQAFSATVCLALASDALPPDQFTAGVGYFSAGTVICQTIGPTLGLGLVSVIGYRATFFLAAIVMSGSSLVASQIKTRSTERKKIQIRLKSIFAIEAVLPASMMILTAVSYCSIMSFLVIYATGKGINQTSVGLYFTVYAVVMLFIRPLVGKLTDKYGLIKTLIPAVVCFIIAFFIISISSSLWILLIAAVFSAAGFGTCQPALQTLCMKCVPAERRGAASSTSYIGEDIGNLIGPIIAGSVITRFGYTAMWRIMTIPFFILIIFAVVFRGRINQIETEFRKRTCI